MYCQKEFSEQKYLNRHIQRHNQKKTCTKCRKVCESVADLEKHVCDPESINEAKRIQEQKKFECHICKNRYSKNSNLRLHIQKCHKPKEDEHVQSTSTTTDETGCFEQKVQSSNITAATTTTSVSSQPQGSLICYMCGDTFTNSAYLKSHLITHQPKKYECDVCDKKFHRNNSCEAHKLTHKNLQVRTLHFIFIIFSFVSTALLEFP